MNWWTKTLIVLVLFNGFEYLTAKSDEGCVGEALQKVKKANSCATQKISLTSGVIKWLGSLLGGNSNGEQKSCCSSYYTLCVMSQTVRKHCSPNTEWSDELRTNTTEFLKCATKDNCTELHQPVGQDCNEYTYSECDSYSWDPKSSSVSKPEPKPESKPVLKPELKPKPRPKPEPKKESKPDSTNSFAPISANGLLLFVSVFVSILIIF